MAWFSWARLLGWVVVGGWLCCGWVCEFGGGEGDTWRVVIGGWEELWFVRGSRIGGKRGAVEAELARIRSARAAAPVSRFDYR